MTAALLAQAKALITEAQGAIASLSNLVTSVQSALDQMKFGPPTRYVSADWGDGVRDATGAIQMEIDSLGPEGGICKVPAGIYMMDAVKGVVVRPKVTLELDPQAHLRVIPNSAPRYTVVRLEDDSALHGGQIIGDRLSHTYTAGSTHEWGYGVKVSGNRAKVIGTDIELCTGDGIALSGDDAEIREVTCVYNRRQGMSVFAAKRGRVYDSGFNYTGDYNGNPGALPMAGVDIEPDGAGSGNAPVCEDVQFIRCRMIGNQSSGLKSYKNTAAAVPAVIRNIAVIDCEFSGNTSGCWFAYCEGLTYTGNRTHDNSGYGLQLLNGTFTDAPISGNEFQNNLTRLGTLTRTATLTQDGTSSATNRDLKIEASAGVCVVGGNIYK